MSLRRRSIILFVLSICGVSLLVAHPDHSATQRTAVFIEPANVAAQAGSEVLIAIEGDRRIIVSNGMPDHATGRFPNSDNPNRIRAQSYRFSMPVKPVANARATPMRMHPFGIAINGVLFDPGTAEFWQDDPESGWHYDAKGNAFSLGLDANNAHVQPNGAYHYHGVPTALLARISGGQPAMALLGWAADGFPIYGVWGYRDPLDPASGVVHLKTSYRLKSGSRKSRDGGPDGVYDGAFVEDFTYVAGSGDLDDCSGRFGVTPEFPQGTYYYVLTEDYPFVPRAFRGTPDPSFTQRRPGPPGPGGRRIPHDQLSR